MLGFTMPGEALSSHGSPYHRLAEKDLVMAWQQLLHDAPYFHPSLRSINSDTDDLESGSLYRGTIESVFEGVPANQRPSFSRTPTDRDSKTVIAGMKRSFMGYSPLLTTPIST